MFVYTALVQYRTFKCTVQPRGVSLRLHGGVAYIDNVGFTDSGALKER